MKHYELCHKLSTNNGLARLHIDGSEYLVRVMEVIANGRDEDIHIRADVCADASDPLTYKKSSFEISRVIFNDPATIVFWKDGSKTVVKCSKDDTFSEEVGLAMAIAKKAYGNDNSFRDKFKTHIPNYMKKEQKKPKPGLDVMNVKHPIATAKKAPVDTAAALYAAKAPKKETSNFGPFVPTAKIPFQFFSRNPDFARPELSKNILKFTRKDGSTFFYTYRSEGLK